MYSGCAKTTLDKTVSPASTRIRIEPSGAEKKDKNASVPQSEPVSRQAAEPDPEKPQRYFSGTPGQHFFTRKKWTSAASEFRKWLKANPSSPLRTQARFVLSCAQLYAGDKHSAGDGFESLVGTMGVLNDYVRLLAAAAFVRQKKSVKVFEHLNAIQAKDFAQSDYVQLIRAEALLHKKQFGAAAKHYSEYLKQNPSAAPRVRLSAARVFDERGNRKRASALLRSILATHPRSRSAAIATKRLNKFPARSRRLTAEEKSTQLQSLYKNKWHKSVLASSESIQRSEKPGSEAWCQAGYHAAKTHVRMKKRTLALAVYKKVVAHCSSRTVYVDALYFGAKQQMKAGKHRVALKWFARMRKVAPEHSYVDDSMRWEAGIYRTLGNDPKAEALLAEIVDGNGDMREDAAWDWVWHHITREQWRAADHAIARVSAAITHEKKSYTNGRLRYWRGRIAEKLGNKVVAGMSYSQCIRQYPLSFYSMMAINRLRSLDSQAAKEALETAMRTEKSPSILNSSRERLKHPRTRRAIELLKLGLNRYAVAELRQLEKELSGNKQDADWFLAYLYDAAGDHTNAYKIARWRRPEYAKSFPSGNHREKWLISYPRPEPYRETAMLAAKQHGIDDALVWAVMRHESAFRPNVVSVANAMGLMQLIPPTARSMAQREGISGPMNRQRLFEPLLNIRLGTRYLGRLWKRFKGHPALIASGYNAGPGRPIRWMREHPDDELDVFVERIPYRETRRYTKSVVTSYLRYRYLYGDKSAPQIPLQLTSKE